jgi:integrase
VSAPLVKTATPGIYRRGGRYVVTFRDLSGKQRKKAARTLAEARALKGQLTADVRRGEYRELKKVTFAEYAPRWIANYGGRTDRGIGSGTRADYRAALGLDEEGKPLRDAAGRELGAVGYFRRTPLAAVDVGMVKEYAAKLSARGLEPASVRKLVAPVKCLFADALEEGLIRSNPAADLRLRFNGNGDDEQNGEEEVKALTEEELQALLAQLDPRHRFFFRFLAETGLRISEAVEVRHRDVEGTWLRVDRRFYRGKVGLPKGRKKRSVRLARELAQELWTLRKETHAGADDLIFTSAKGNRLDPSNLASRILKPAGRGAGVGDWVHHHTFRHTAATRLFRSGWNAAQVQLFLGHSDPGFTLRVYVHLLPTDLPEPSFPEPGGNEAATDPTEIDRDSNQHEQAESGLDSRSGSVQLEVASYS